MKWLILAIIVFGQQQPARAPEGTSEPNSGQSIVHAKNAENPGASTTQEAAGEEHATQRKLLWFTGILAGVAILQLVVMFLTWLVYRRQAGIMEQQRATMESQWTTMQGQLSQMSVQSGILKDSVELVVNKERARIRMGQPQSLILSLRIPLKVEFLLFFYGSTPAFSVSSEVYTVLSDSPDSIDNGFFGHGIHHLPTVASASDFTAAYSDFMLRPAPLDEPTAQRIRNREVYVHFKGCIKYLDFFDKPRETAFHYRWNPRDDSANALSRLIYPEGWVEVGGETENYYT